MKTRFFYAAHSHSTWPKLFVLSENGIFYCEYLDYMHPATINKQFDFETFSTNDYSYKGYQNIIEIDRATALQKSLTRQANWIQGYLDSLD
jgi:hypothetical protein